MVARPKIEYPPAMPAEGHERRTRLRKATQLRTQTFENPQAPIAGWIVDLSRRGCRLEAEDAHFRAGQYLTLAVDEHTLVDGIVRWTQGNALGVEFLWDLPEQFVARA